MIIHQRKSVTLIELIIAVTLVAVIILGINSISIFSHYQVVSSDRRSRLQNEVSFCLDHMTKHISQAVGDLSRDPIAWYDDSRGIRVRVDDNPANGEADATDTWIGYRHEDNRILYFSSDPDGTHTLPSEVISHRILTSDLGASPNTWGVVFDRNEFNNLVVIVRARWDPALPVSNDNPEVSMQSIIHLPSVSAQ
jgi:hypothetical protein